MSPLHSLHILIVVLEADGDDLDMLPRDSGPRRRLGARPPPRGSGLRPPVQSPAQGGLQARVDRGELRLNLKMILV